MPSHPSTWTLALLIIAGSCGQLRAQHTAPPVGPKPRSADAEVNPRSMVDAPRLQPSRPQSELNRAWFEFFTGPSPSESTFEPQIPDGGRRGFVTQSERQFNEMKPFSYSEGGALRRTLTVAYAENKIGKDFVWLRSYNGKLVGPTLRAKPGDVLQIRLDNRLSYDPPGHGEHNTLHNANVTNLHTHGLHVSPAGNSDNVLLSVNGGHQMEYEIRIPGDHPCGTFWYHSHNHGSVALQVSSGMAGALIIEGGDIKINKDLRKLDSIGKTRERIFVFQQIPYYNSTGSYGQETPGVVELEYEKAIFGPGTWERLGRQTTINGVLAPLITLRPGEVEHWRLIHAGVRESLKLELQPSDGSERLNLYEIAVDGLALGRLGQDDDPAKKKRVELWPGYRSDVLVQAPMHEGEYLLVDEQSPSERSLNAVPESKKYLARVRVEGKENRMNLPTESDLAPFRQESIKKEVVVGTQKATYGIRIEGERTFFQIDGKEFDDRQPRRLRLNSVDEWTLKAENVNVPFAVSHPFHIHVNPFELVSVVDDKSGQELLKYPVWRDTLILVPGRIYKMRTRYVRYVGSFVQHCHILDHEDQGMMELITIEP